MMHAFRTAEFDLVVSCTAWPFAGDAIERARNAAARVTDHQRVIDLIDRHRVAGLVANALQVACITLPEPQATLLNDRARTDAAQELGFLQQTLALTKAMAAADVSVRVLKGVTTAITAYGRFGVRFSSDIDMLVAQDDVPRAAAVLADTGYVRTEPPADADAATMAARMARHKDVVFQHPATGTVVELHWRLFQNPCIMAGAVDLPPATLDLLPGLPVGVLPRDTAWMYLCVHGGEHGWARLKWIADLGALLNKSRSAGEILYWTARATGLRRMVGPGIVICQRLYGIALPPQLERDMARDWRLRSLVGIAWDSLVGGENPAELEQRAHGTTRKNLSHYLMSNDPRQLWNEFLFDLADRPHDDHSGGRGRIMRLATRLWAVARRPNALGS